MQQLHSCSETYLVCEPRANSWAIGTKRGTKLDPIILIDFVPEYLFPLTGSPYLVATMQSGPVSGLERSFQKHGWN